MKKDKITEFISRYRYLLLIVLCATGVLLMLANKKAGMHIDEYFSYGLANSTYESNHGSIYIAFQNGVKMDPKSAFDKYLFADSFSLKDVWNNQKNDTHPPLYYLLFHIWGLITNNFWGLKTGILLNILFHICNSVLVYKIINTLLKRESYSLVGSGMYAMLPIILGNVIFIRMYVLAECFVLLLTLIFVTHWENDTFDKTFYLEVGLTSACGILTHYYFLVWLFYACAIWEIRLVQKRKWKEMILFASTMAATGMGSYIIFPHMKYHILHGSRGTESIDNLFHSSYWENLRYFFETLDHVAGGILLILLIVTVLLLLYRNRDWKFSTRAEKAGHWCIILGPVCLYYLTVSKIAVMQSTRYISVLYGLVVISLMGLFKWLLQDIKNVKTELTLLIVLVGIILGTEWKEYDWPELYLDDTAYIEISKEYAKQNDCIYIYKDSWHGMKSYQEFINYDNIVFIPYDQMELLQAEEYQNYENVIVFMDESIEIDVREEILYKMINSNPTLSIYQELYTNECNISYLVE